MEDMDNMDNMDDLFYLGKIEKVLQGVDYGRNAPGFLI